MTLKEIISVDKKFQTSVNIEYDINSFAKIEGYIPTEQSVAVLDKFLHEIYFSSESKKANVLVGPYGRGKSHLLLVLSSLLSLDVVSSEKAKAQKVLTTLCAKIARVNQDTGALAKEILNKKIRLLPVIINSNGIDINQNLILAIRDALTRAGLINLLPTTHFDAALEVLKMWQDSYPEAYKNFVNELKKRKVEVKNFDILLAQYNVEAYETFCEIYPLIAVGTKFNPYSNTNVIDLYLAVNQALKTQSQYSGMFIIFDEFSKFIESNLDKTRMQNFKIIQDLAEIVEREKSIHFTCVTHKSLLDYSTSDSFKTVEGRFRNINFVASSEQSYELIANAIIKSEQFKAFKDKYQGEFENLINASLVSGIFRDISEESLKDKLVYGCFPIAPITAYALLRVSEKVGQNERTVFTFLAQNQEDTLVDFLKSHTGFSLMTVDYVFNYFKDLFRKSTFNKSVHSMWAKADSALYQTNDETSCRIIKALAIFGIVADDNLRPISTHIKAALNLSDEEFDIAIKKLTNKKIIAQRESSEYVLLTANGVDVQNNVKNYIDSKITKLNRCDILNKMLDFKYLLPRQYNDEYCMIRYFKIKFMEAVEFNNTKNWIQLFENEKADGILLYILSDNKEDRLAAIKHVAGFENQQHIVLNIPDENWAGDRLVKQYYSVQQLKLSNEAKLDQHYYEELCVFEDDTRKRLLKEVESFYSPSSGLSKFYNCDGEVEDIRKQVKLNKEISQICLKKYTQAPKINNELINKDDISTPVKKARSLIIKHIFDNLDEKEIPPLPGLGPEVSIFKSVFEATGLSKSNTTEDPGLNSVLIAITEFIRTAEEHKRAFSELYNVLLAAPFGVRRGIIPMLLAYSLSAYKENVIIYYGKVEVQLSDVVLDQINENKGVGYQILLESGTKTKDKSITELLDLYSDFSSSQSKSISKIYNVVRCMQNWMRALPEYTKKCTRLVIGNSFIELTEKETEFRKELLKFEINSREFLFEFLFNDSTEDGHRNTIEWVKKVKEKFENHLNEVKSYLISQVKSILSADQSASLGSAIIVWKKKLSEETCSHMFDGLTNQVLNYLTSIRNFDDDSIIFELCRLVVNMDLADWNDKTLDKFIQSFSDAIQKINGYENSASKHSGENGIELKFNGTKITKTFSTSETSPLGKTLLSNLQFALDEYGDAISPDEKLNIMIKIIKDIIG